jgi:hypothetical protein
LPFDKLPVSPSTFTERRLPPYLLVLFCTALVVHFHFATRNWHYRFMAGHEFRQTQTALIAHYIDAENNFSIDYSVPLLGKPWVLPLEFPLYEWGVVALSRATHLPQFEAARAISLSCFYLTLPALYLLLGQLALPRARRLFVLACALLCPVYIFYARAVLIDPMALLCSVWFLAAFTRMLAPPSGDAAQSRRSTARWGWLPLVVICGTAAGLIKSLVWFVWVVPAIAYGLWRLGHDWREGGARPALRTLAWGIGSFLVPFAATLWWAHYTDAIKTVHPSAFIFTAHNLAHGNYGTFSLSAHLSAYTWKNLFACWQQSLLPPWAFALFIVPGLIFLPLWRCRIAGATILFLVAQMTIPLAYALQDYYFYAANLFAVAAVAFVFLGLLDSKLPRLLSAALLLVPLAALFASYRADYFKLQSPRSPGGSGLTEALQAYTPPRSVLIVAGDDWNAVIPYYAERKALMIRRGLETNGSYLDRAFADLANEDVAALVLVGDQRSNQALATRTAAAFNLDPHPTFRHTSADVYLAKPYRNDALRALQKPTYDQIQPAATPPPLPGDTMATDAVSPTLARTVFSMIAPAPVRAHATFGFEIIDHAGERLLNAHPDSDLWVPPPAGATRIECEFGILPGAYLDEGKTNGVEFTVLGVLDDGSSRELYRRLLKPVEDPADRGLQTAAFAFQPRPGETVVFRTRPNGNPSFDWAFWRRIEIK